MRLFVALELPDGVREDLARAIDALRPAAENAKWVPPENLHLTVVFLGETPSDRVSRLVEALELAAADVVPFSTSAEGVGAFPSPRRARVLWAGLADSGGDMARVAEAVASRLEETGIPRELREFTPHVTLARFRAPQMIASLPEIALDPTPFVIDHLTLFRSRLSRPSPRYEPILALPLGRTDVSEAE